MATVSQNTKYVKLDDGVSFALVRTNPKLTTNTKLMYNGKSLYMESYASSPLLNRMEYKNVSVKSNGTYNKDIASFLRGSGMQAYNVYQNFSDDVISDSYDNQFETMYWCGAEYIDSSFYTEEIGFVAPLYLREKLPNYFLIFRLDTPSNYNLNVDEKGNVLDPTFDFKTDILDKSVLIKTFDLREGSPLGNYIHNYINQELFEFDKSMYVNFANGEVTYYGINRGSGILEKKVENFEKILLNNDNPVITDDKWFTEGFERNNLIFPYIMNIEYLFDDESFTHKDGESYDFARYIGVYCNNIEFGEFANFDELKESGYTQDNAIYYFEDNKKKLHRYTNNESDGLKINGKDYELFDMSLISGFEKEKVTGYAEPLDIYEGFKNRAQYGFEILKQLEPGDWVGIEYNGHVECYFADNKNINVGETQDVLGGYDDSRFFVDENSTLNDIAASLANCVNNNKKSKFEASYSENAIVFYAKRDGKEYNGSPTGGAKMLMEASLLYNNKISLPISNFVKHIRENDEPIEDISDSDSVIPAFNEYGILEKSVFGNYYIDYFCGACDVDIDENSDVYKNVFKIYAEECAFFDVGRYLKTKNGNGRRICSNIIYVNSEGSIDSNYRIVIVDNVPEGKENEIGYDVSISSTNQVEIMDIFKPNHGVLSWFPIKDFDFDINYSTYGQYVAFSDECNNLSKKITYNTTDTEGDSKKSMYDESTSRIKKLAKSPFFDDYGNFFETEYDYYLEQIHPDLCLLSKTAPYISKWGYYDEQKDSCENPYRLNVNKVFGISNLSANTFLRNCDENHYTHNMPYFMTFGSPNYYKEYQYIESDENYKIYNTSKYNITYIDDGSSDIEDQSPTFLECVDYWIGIFKSTDEDNFSYFFSGKKYGKRFDRKYSRLLGGDKFHNPSTLFRGVKFEAVRQYNGVEKRSSEYNDYKFSFIYIPIMINTMVFNSTVYFVKNDTFKFIVGIVFVNTMLGVYEHNIFKGSFDYFNKGFLYSACKDIIKPENTNNKYKFDLNVKDNSNNVLENIIDIESDFWENCYNKSKGMTNTFYMWKDVDNNEIVVTDYKTVEEFGNPNDKINVIGVFYEKSDNGGGGIKLINTLETKYYILNDNSFSSDSETINIYYGQYYEDYDVTIYRYKTFKYYGTIECTIKSPDIKFKNNILIDICDIGWEYYDKVRQKGYKVNVSNLYLESESLRNILININDQNCVKSIKFYNIDGKENESTIIGTHEFINDEDGVKIVVNVNEGNIIIDNGKDVVLTVKGENNEIIENLRMDIIIKDDFDNNFESLGLKDYFSVFNQISTYNITESINNDYNIKYYSTVEDNKYKIRVIEPDSIEIEDKYEVIPVKTTNNNKSVIGSVVIKKKMNVD